MDTPGTTHPNRGKRCVATMPARIDAITAPQVERDLLALADGGADLIVCDLAQTVYVSSAGLRVMLLLTKRQRGAGRRFVLTGLGAQVLQVFQMARFDAILEIRDSAESVQ